MREVMPVLTPIGLDPAHPFPRVLNKSLNFAVELEGATPSGATPAPPSCRRRACPQVIRLPKELCEQDDAFVFPVVGAPRPRRRAVRRHERIGCYQFRVTRNSDMFVDEEEVKDLRATLRASCSSATSATRCASSSPTTARGDGRFLMKQFALDRADVACRASSTSCASTRCPTGSSGPTSKYRLRPACRRSSTRGDNIFAAVRGDILLHPFQSFGR